MKQGLHQAVILLTLCIALLVCTTAARADDPYVGEIRMFAYDFCPKKWLEADGRELPIVNYTWLYSLYGNTYGGDGIRNFALPDLRGRVPLGNGQGPGRADYWQGQTGGVEQSELSKEQLPQHAHSFWASQKRGEHHTALALGGEAGKEIEQAIYHIGGIRPHENLPPYQAIRYCVAYEGRYPPRN